MVKGSVSMNCPVCDKPLIVLERDNIEVEYCLNCSGFWLDAGELELINEKLNLGAQIISPFKYPQTRTTEKVYKCPRCQKNMKKVKIKNVILDICEHEDGIWFDSGELANVLSSTASDDATDKMVSFLGENFCKK